MKFLKLSILAILLVSFFVGCATKAPSKADVSIKGSDGVIFVYRPKNYIWRHKRFNIYINGNYEDLILDGRYLSFNKPAGKYKIEIKEDVEFNPEIYTQTIDLEKSQVIYLRLGTESVEGHLKLKKVQKRVALYEDDLYQKMY
ncbi:hypothetical protein ACKGJI_11225 [Sulfurospirillum sp. 1307]|jgi:hypothetical protein